MTIPWIRETISPTRTKHWCITLCLTQCARDIANLRSYYKPCSLQFAITVRVWSILGSRILQEHTHGQGSPSRSPSRSSSFIPSASPFKASLPAIISSLCAFVFLWVKLMIHFRDIFLRLPPVSESRSYRRFRDQIHTHMMIVLLMS